MSTQHDRGGLLLLTSRARVCAAAVGLGLLGASAQLLGGQAHEGLMISATVVPTARLHMALDMPPLQVSAADVAAGYIDAPQALMLRVESNSLAGFAVEVSALGPWFDSVALQGFDAEVLIDGAGGTVVQRWVNGKSRSLALWARFRLSPAVLPGLYAWPLRLSARPL